jgi:hypothetical protein
MFENIAIIMPHYVSIEILPICAKEPLKQLNRDLEGYLSVRFWDCGVRKRTLVCTNGPIAMLAGGIIMLLTPLFERQSQKSSTSQLILAVLQHKGAGMNLCR